MSDGSLSNVFVNPATDPTDGFVYHDERINPALDAARFASAITWPKKQGFFVCHENLMAPSGSQFSELVIGNVVDVACDIAYATGSAEVSNDLRITDAGTLVPTDALKIQSNIDGALASGMIDVAMVSDAFASVSRTANVYATKNIPIAVSVIPRGYVDTITETISLVP